MTLSITK